MTSCPRFKFFKEELRFDGRVFAVEISARATKKALPLGRITVKANGGEPSVSHIKVDERYQRCGLGTRLYEEAAKLACKRFKGPLRSDIERSTAADTFWQKQVAKGRARCLEATDKPSYADDTPDMPIVGRSNCWRYVLTCPAPASLAKPPTRRRR